MTTNFYRSMLAAAVLAACLHGPARAHGNASDASVLSALPIAVSVAAPVMILSGGVMLTVVAVEASAEGTVWVLERASDGARASVTLSAMAAGGLSLHRLRREAGRTPSPNSGWPMAAMALGVGVRLGKPGGYVLHAAGRAACGRDTACAISYSSKALLALVVLTQAALIVVAMVGQV